MDLLTLEHEIIMLKNEMIMLAMSHNLDLLHPQVLAVSEKLDILIVLYMNLYKLPVYNKSNETIRKKGVPHRAAELHG